MKALYLFILTLGLALSVQAQDRAPSPSSKMEQKVGLTDITVEYSRPGLKNRVAFGAGTPLAPLDKMWRTGANAATKVTFSDAVKIEGKDVPAGEYAMTTIPGATSWTVNLYPYTASRWTTYRDATPTASVTATPVKADFDIETFMISFDMIKDYSAVLVLGWGNTIVPINVTVN